MQEDYLKYLKLESKKFAKQHNILDIILFGSVVKGKQEAGDIDLLIIFKDETLKNRTEIGQRFKRVVKKIKNPDVKTINLKELFDEDFLARQGVLIEGFSLLKNKAFSKSFGFEGYALFSYSLKNLNHNEKTKFTYVLIGRNKEGILKQTNTKHLGRGSVMVPIQNSLMFEEFLEKWKISYTKKNILVSLI